MYSSKPTFVYGFHGIDKRAALRILLQKTTLYIVITHMTGLVMVFISGKTTMQELFNMPKKTKKEKL